MTLKSLSKQMLCLIMVIPILVSLTVLGMRLPTFGGLTSGKPKNRPRAVLQTQIEKVKDSFQLQQALDCVLQNDHFALLTAAPQQLHSFSLVANYSISDTSPTSRAPPSFRRA
jgi:hypothetical protein